MPGLCVRPHTAGAPGSLHLWASPAELGACGLAARQAPRALVPDMACHLVQDLSCPQMLWYQLV